MRSTKILAIAPYQGLKELMEASAASRSDLQLTVYLGDLSDGAALVHQVQDQGFDVIISRGGTTRMIEKIAHIPVVEIMLSGYDMLRTIRLAQSYHGRFAIVGFPSITSCAQLICDLIQYPTDIFTIYNSEEATQCIQDLAAKGYSLIVGDAVTVSQSKQMGLNSILIISGSESIEAAFDQAVKLCRTIEQQNDQQRLMKDVLSKCGDYFSIYTHDGFMIAENIPALFPAPAAELRSYLVKKIPLVLDTGGVHFSRRFGKNLCCIRGSTVSDGTMTYATFFARWAFAVPEGDDGWLTIKNPTEEATRSFNTFYNSSQNMEAFILQTRQFSSTSLPILILGEQGTGKETIAYTMHVNSALSRQPFVILDCSRMSLKKWDFLLESSDSPLCLSDHGIFFKNLQALDREIESRLELYIRVSSVHHRNRLFFSWCHQPDQKPSDDLLVTFLLNFLGCLTLTVPSLYDRRDDIPSLISVVLGELNLELGKQVIDLEADALRLLQQFPWEGNFEQFRTVISQLVILSSGPTISTATVHLVLEKQHPTFSLSGRSIPPDKTLDQIVNDVICTVLAEEDNNQSRAAVRLGISRGMLWRRLKTMDA